MASTKVGHPHYLQPCSGGQSADYVGVVRESVNPKPSPFHRKNLHTKPFFVSKKGWSLEPASVVSLTAVTAPVTSSKVSVATVAPKGQTCSRCNKPTKGHPGPSGIKCSNIPATPELLSNTPGNGDTSLTLTPVREIREKEDVISDSISKQTLVEEENPEEIDTVSRVIQSMDISSMMAEAIAKHKSSKTM